MSLLSQSQPIATVHRLDTEPVIIGRSRRCTIRVAHATVSREHVSLCWTEEGWLLSKLRRDNLVVIIDRGGVATEVEGRALIVKGDSFLLADAQTCFTLLDDRRPLAQAIGLESREVRLEDEERLGLSLGQGGELLMLRLCGKRWVVEDGQGAKREVRDGDTLAVAGQAWRLQLPEADDWTRKGERLLPVRADLDLRLTLVNGVEGVRCVVQRGPGHVDLGVKPRHALLWALGQHPGEWLGLSSLLEAMGMKRQDRRRLYNDAHRIRNDLHEVVGLSLEEADQVLESERGRRRLALPTHRVTLRDC